MDVKVPQDPTRFKDWADKACCVEGAVWPDELTIHAAHAYEGLQKGDRTAFEKFEAEFVAWQGGAA